jgi:hypothetical protein
MSLDPTTMSDEKARGGSKDWLFELRSLRKEARSISRHLKEDVQAFRQADGTYAIHPPSMKVAIPTSSSSMQAPAEKPVVTAAQPGPPKVEADAKPDVHVTTTCTVLMTLAAARLLTSVFGEDNTEKEVLRVFDLVVQDEWSSDGLPVDNAFNKVLVLRLAGFLAQERKCSPNAILERKHGDKTLRQIAEGLVAEGDINKFSVQDYPPKAALVYWYVDALDLLNIDIGRMSWRMLAAWAGEEFGRQLAYVASNNAALMDPVSMIMAACLAERIRKIAVSRRITDDVSDALPSTVEINHSITLLFLHQTESGIWPKYFPLFHFVGGGANYCFTFELLEALVNEFGDTDLDPRSGKSDADTSLFQVPRVLDGINMAVSWCRLNRLGYPGQGVIYRGWNSGGNLKALRADKPESWATATVHWFLHKLDYALSTAIQRAVLDKYIDVRPLPAKDRRKWSEIADSRVQCPGTTKSTVKDLLEEEFLNPLSSLPADGRLTVDGRRSALLFGPPGTAKTTIVRELARSIGWPCVEVRPSNFLKGGLERIYESADEIFTDLMDLSQTVIFFDEMDALVQSRTAPLDVTRQFLTTSMLPKLAELHDQGRVVFFVATNYRATFDEAVIRPGRFDLLLFVGPPSWEEKLKALQSMVKNHPLSKDLPSTGLKPAVQIMQANFATWATRNNLVDQLQLFTFGETKGLVEQLLKHTNQASLPAAAAKIDETAFVSAVNEWSENYVILREPRDSKAGEIRLIQAAKNWFQANSVTPGRTEYANYLRDKTASRLQ